MTARTPETTRLATASLPCSPLSPMAASNACQRARPIMPTTVTTTSVLPIGLLARFWKAPVWSLSADELPNASCRAIQARTRWMTPYAMKPPRARYSRGLLSAAREAVPRTCEEAVMGRTLSGGKFSQTFAMCRPAVLTRDLDADAVRGDAVQADLQAADVHRRLAAGELDLLAGDLEGGRVLVGADELRLDAQDADAGVDRAVQGDRALVQPAGDVVVAASGEQ